MSKFEIAIHHRKNSFSDRWIEYCKKNHITCNIVNCFDSNIVDQLASSNALLWHWVHHIPEDILIARHVIRAAESMGVKVFPSSQTCCTYDDKISQKYLLEAIGAPLIPTYVFYDEKTAMEWINQTTFPKVFKLSKGAGSFNVALIHTAHEAGARVKQAFGKGFKPFSGQLRENIYRFKSKQRRKKHDWFAKIKRAPQSLANIYRSNKYMGREKGYIYFQKFIPDNLFDIRMIVVGNRALGYIRNVRKNDFRASGSGDFDFDAKKIHPQCVPIAFNVTQKLNTQSLAIDFVINAEGKPLIAEISYCYGLKGIDLCEGYWDPQLQWHPGSFWPQDAIMADLIEQIQKPHSQIPKNKHPEIPQPQSNPSSP